jgi:hypothetical protein
VSSPNPSFWSRFVLAWSSFFRILFDADFAVLVSRARNVGRLPQLEPAKPEPGRAPPPDPEPQSKLPPKAEVEPDVAPALQLLALFQREGRLVDFLQQDLTGFGDAEIGAATRVVHDGCKRALTRHVKVAPIRSEAEGAKVTLEAGYAPAQVKLTGNVGGSAPYRGVLRHRGWRAESIDLPRAVGYHDARVLAPAEIEL